jgi:ATP-dependent Clp protease ATP-binding subunit ClpA
MADIKRLFTPEFRNRLDATVSFKALDEVVILRVVDKFLLQLETQLAEKKVEVTFTDKLRKHLAKKGFDPLMGARPMQRLIQDTIRRRWPTNCCSAASRKAGDPTLPPLKNAGPVPAFFRFPVCLFRFPSI